MPLFFTCPICSSDSIASTFTVTREDKYATHNSNTKREPAEYTECLNCGAMVLQNEGNFELSYGDGYYYSVDGDPATFLQKRFAQITNLPPEKSDNIQRVKRIQEYLLKQKFTASAPLQALDIGAGMGVFFHAFLSTDFGKKGWSSTVVEPDPACCEHLKSVLPSTNVLQGYSSKVGHSTKYHLITFNRVLEHIQNPVSVLKAEHNNLRDDGILYLEVPDVWSLTYDGPNNEAFGYGHSIVYSPSALERVASQAGFELIHLDRVIEPSTKFTLYAFFRKALSGPRLQGNS